VTAEAAFMRRAIALAQAQVGRTGDNPAVGCVLARSGQVVGEGATGDGGRPHAEEAALARAGSEAAGAVAYVTLEPCAERSAGGTSCAERLVQAGVVKVVFACDDPSAYAGGRGAARLREAGATVEAGLLREEALRLYTAYRPKLGGA
jgi:diaminohydroxyphosphoribosylaminopyrimidine deaminase/5-amino-6-(5-phosphoribosylamino)uracil reductase